LRRERARDRNCGVRVIGNDLHAGISLATPIALAALGETVVECAGILNLGLEGMMLAGAFGGAAGAIATGSAWGGLLCGVACALFVALAFGRLALWERVDQVIAGTALNLFVFGATAVLWRATYGKTGSAPGIAPGFGEISVPLLSEIPVAGRALFQHHIFTFLLFAAAPVLWVYVRRTGAGLRLRACGENPAAAAAMGVPVRAIQFRAILICGVVAGLAGATLSLAEAHTFADNMSAGRGYVAIALVIFGAHHPLGAAAASLLFGAAQALELRFQAAGWTVPPEWFRALPYVLSLLVLAGFMGRRRSPAALGRRPGDGLDAAI
jgi:ABC-type uncharacterized transport system permease subunit